MRRKYECNDVDVHQVASYFLLDKWLLKINFQTLQFEDLITQFNISATVRANLKFAKFILLKTMHNVSYRIPGVEQDSHNEIFQLEEPLRHDISQRARDFFAQVLSFEYC